MQKKIYFILLIGITVLFSFFTIFKQKNSVRFSEKIEGEVQSIHVPTLNPNKTLTFEGKSFFNPFGKFRLLYPSYCLVADASPSPNYKNPTIECHNSLSSFVLIPQAGGHRATVSKRDTVQIGSIIWYRSIFNYEGSKRETYGFLYHPNQTYYVVEVIYPLYSQEVVKEVQSILATFTPIISS